MTKTSFWFHWTKYK